MFTLF